MVPRIVVRDEYVDMVGGNTTELDYMFDTNHFINSLTVSCPQMRVYKAASTITDRQHAYGPISLGPESLVKKIPKTGLPHPQEWRGLFYKWLSQYVSEDTKGPIIIDLGRSYLQYPTSSDDGAFVHHFGKILKVRPDARSLATMTLLKLTDAYSLQLHLSDPILKKAFLGVYLSTDVDGLAKDDQVNARYETQSKLYFAQAAAANLSLIYAASKFGDDILNFIKDAGTRNITVTTKLDLLKGKDREQLLNDFTPDQSLLVDYLVMAKASEFAGVGHSSFAWNIALKRHQFTTQKEDELDGPQVFGDTLSQIYGPPDGHTEFAACMWP